MSPPRLLRGLISESCYLLLATALQGAAWSRERPGATTGAYRYSGRVRRLALQAPGYEVRRALGFACRHMLPRGRARFARLLCRYPGETEIEYLDRLGHRRRADLRDEMEVRLFTGRGGLPDHVVNRLGRGDWVLDVGASIGRMTGQLCRRVGPSGSVWAIEPVPSNLRRLEELRRLNPLPQLQVLPYAASSTSGRAEVLLPRDGGSAYASFSASWIRGERLEVETRRLDDLVAELGAPGRLTFIKLDVEGHERQVLDGAVATLAAFRPLVYCEFNDVIQRDAGSSSAELLARFRDLGYSVAPEWEVGPGGLDGRVCDLLLTPAAS